MAVASYKTLLPLDTFARIAGIHPLHFNQVVDLNIWPDNVPPAMCGEPYTQFSWQAADKTGREEIAQTIADVESLLTDHLNFSPVPVFYANKPLQYPKPSNPDIFATSMYDARSLFRAVRLGAGYVVSGGVEAFTSVALGAAVVYTDTDGDGYKETATITATTTVTDNSELAIYYLGTSHAPEWEIRPISATINGGVATITCRREQLVKPELMFGLIASGVDGLMDSNFLATVDVYRHWLDPSQTQVEFRTEQTPWLSGSSAVQYSVQTGAMLPRDAKLGWADLEMAHWDATSGSYVYDCNVGIRMPDNVRVWFKAGWPLDAHGQMDGIWARAITYYVLARLDRPLCACDSLRTFTDYWSFDWAKNNPSNTQQIARKRLENPLGTTRAAVYMWEQIQRYRLPDAVSD